MSSRDFSIDFDVRDFLDTLERADRQAVQAAKRGMEDCVDELVRISSEITPLDKGILQRSHSREVTESRDDIKGKVEYSVAESNSNGHFNYALWTHEADYEIGEDSRQRPGTSGWSGRRYEVGNKYLERPLQGEEDAFFRHIADEIRRELGGG